MDSGDCNRLSIEAVLQQREDNQYTPPFASSEEHCTTSAISYWPLPVSLITDVSYGR